MTQAHLTGLAQVDRAILAKDRHAVLKIILENARRLTNADTAQLYQPIGQHLILALTFPTASPLAKNKRRQKLAARESSCGIAMSKRKALIVPDIRLYKELYPHPADADFLSELVAPLWSDDEPLGAISLTSAEPNHFRDDHASICEALAEQAAVATVHADVLDQLEELRQVDHAILKEGISLEEIGAVILGSIRRLTRAEKGQILTVDWRRRLLEVVASTGSDVGLEVSLDDSVSGDAVIEKRAIRIGNWEKDKKYRRKFKAILSNTLSELVVPMLTAEVSLALNVESARENAFTARHERMIEDFARQAAIAIRYVTWSRHSLDDLQAITRTAIELSSVSRYEPLIYQRALLAAQTIADTSHCQILMQRDKNLRVEATTGDDAGTEVPIARCASGWFMKQKKLFHLSNDLEEDPVPDFQQWLPVKTQSVLMVGIKSGEGYVGVINVESGEKNHFDERHISLVTRLAEHLAGALYINKSYQGLRHVGHDLLATAGALGLSVDSIRSSLAELPPQVDKALGRISLLAEDLSARKEDILPREAWPELLIPSEICRRVVSLAAVDSITELPGQPWGDIPPIAFDYLHATRVFMHLLENSKDAMTNTVQKKITMDATYDDSQKLVRVTVKDNGVGMTKEQVEEAFLPGYTRKVAGRGSGLGLSFCEQVMTAGRGTIRIANTEPGVGTTIEVCFPRAAGMLLARSTSADLGRNGKALIISDDRIWSDRVIAVLQQSFATEGNGVSCSSFLTKSNVGQRMLGMSLVWADVSGPVDYSLKLARRLLDYVDTAYAHSRSRRSTGSNCITQFMCFAQGRLPQTPDLVRAMVREAKAEAKKSKGRG